MSKSKYESLGASASKAGIHQALEESGVTPSGTLFANVAPDLSGSADHYSFIHCDGAGTKTIVAYLLYKETGSVAAFEHAAQDALVMNLDDIYCLGSPQSLILSNLINRNARLVGDDVIAAIVRSYRKLCERFSSAGIPISLAGGETADVGDVVRTILVDAILAGRIAKQSLIDTAAIKPGDVIVGLSSTGRSTYEELKNSGIGSNGLTLARHTLLAGEYARRYPEIKDPGTPATVAYSGEFRLDDTPPGLGMTIGEALSSPTRSYAPMLTTLYKELPSSIHGAIHVTGGGLTKVLRFGSGNRYIKDSLFGTPPVFALIQEQGNVSWQEMYQVFNMGHRFELYLPENCVDTVCNVASSFNIEARRIGFVEANDTTANEVIVRSANGEFSYRL